MIRSPIALRVYRAVPVAIQLGFFRGQYAAIPFSLSKSHVTHAVWAHSNYLNTPNYNIMLHQWCGEMGYREADASAFFKGWVGIIAIWLVGKIMNLSISLTAWQKSDTKPVLNVHVTNGRQVNRVTHEFVCIWVWVLEKNKYLSLPRHCAAPCIGSTYLPIQWVKLKGVSNGWVRTDFYIHKL